MSTQPKTTPTTNPPSELQQAAHKQLLRLLGGTITRSIRTTDASGELFGIEVKRAGLTFNVWFLADFEGNGPGGFAIDKE